MHEDKGSLMCLLFFRFTLIVLQLLRHIQERVQQSTRQYILIMFLNNEMFHSETSKYAAFHSNQEKVTGL